VVLRAIMTVILIVEDDVLANEHLEFILHRAGYQVLSATSADEAAELLEGHPDVQLLVTDINLPGRTNGLKLAAATKALRPDVNIIIVTGYSAPKSDEIPPGSLFIAKPYDARKMIEAVRHFQWPL
jgi:DNA-binding NtrC family response regulator